MELIANKIKSIIESELPNFYNEVEVRKSSFSNSSYLKIVIAASNYEINRVKGQYVQDVSLVLHENLELKPQVFGGNGGQSIYREPNMNDPKEKYLAMKSVKVPFRTPMKKEENVLQAIKKFCQNYKQTLKDNIETLKYQNLVDYKGILK